MALPALIYSRSPSPFLQARRLGKSMRANENAQALPGTHTEQKLKDLEVHRNKSRGFLDKIQAQALPVQQELIVSSYTQEVVQSMRLNENAQALPGTQTEQTLQTGRKLR